MRRVAMACLFALATLVGCQEQRTIVVEQAQAGSIAAAAVPGEATPAAAPHRPHGPPQCNPPWGSGPFTQVDKPTSTQPVPKPVRAMAEHVNGCGGIRFRIGPDGAPQDIEILAEYPIGFGFGEHVKQLVLNSHWSPRDDLSWHYLNYTVLVPHA